MATAPAILDLLSSSNRKHQVYIHDEEQQLDKSGIALSIEEISELMKSNGSVSASIMQQTSSSLNNEVSSSSSSAELASSLWGSPRQVVLIREENKSLGISIVGGKLDVYSSNNSPITPQATAKSLQAVTQSNGYVC